MGKKNAYFKINISLFRGKLVNAPWNCRGYLHKDPHPPLTARKKNFCGWAEKILGNVCCGDCGRLGHRGRQAFPKAFSHARAAVRLSAGPAHLEKSPGPAASLISIPIVFDFFVEINCKMQQIIPAGFSHTRKTKTLPSLFSRQKGKIGGRISRGPHDLPSFWAYCLLTAGGENDIMEIHPPWVGYMERLSFQQPGIPPARFAGDRPTEKG